MKSEKEFGPNFFWVLGGIPKPNTNANFEYYIIPSSVMAKNVVEAHQLWLKSPGVKGQKHKDNTVRTVYLPPYKSAYSDFDLSKYRDRWDLIEQKLRA
jgi:hypothetical protein